MKTLTPISPAADDFIPTAAAPDSIAIDTKEAKIVRRKRIELRRLSSRNSDNKQFPKPRRQESDDEATTSNSSPCTSSSTPTDNLSNIVANKPTRTCLSYGAAVVMGRRREMEDAISIAKGFTEINSRKLDFFGVFDGHGGAMVAEACKDRMHQILGREIEEEITVTATEDQGKKVAVVEDGERGDGLNWEKVMVSCFEKMDREVGGGNGPKEEGDEMTVGSTAVTAVIGKETVVVANCGDSRAVICRKGVAVPLSVDHKPDRPDELARIEAAGGKVIDWNGARVLGVLSTSRSIGDNYLKPYVISNPEVTVCKRTHEDEFLILATDGLWDVVSNEIACQVVRKCLCGRLRIESTETQTRTRASEAAAFLTNLAMAKGSRDNISVVVVELKKFRRFTSS